MFALLSAGVFFAGAWRSCPRTPARASAQPAQAAPVAPPAPRAADADEDERAPRVRAPTPPRAPARAVEEPAPDERDASDDVATGVRVRVTDKATARAVEAYLVTIVATERDGPEPLEADVSSADGVFVGARPAGRYRVTVVAEGYRPGGVPQVFVEESRVAEASVALERSIAVHGTVTDAVTKRAIAGAQVALGGARDVPPVVTDERGRFALPSVYAEDLTFEVSAEGYVTLNLGGVNGARSRDEQIDVQLTPRTPGGSSGEVVGIGAVVSADRKGVKIGDVIEGGPAEGALAAGDIVTHVDGVPLTGKPLRERIGLLRGAVGSSARLMVIRADGTKSTIDLERKRVQIP